MKKSEIQALLIVFGLLIGFCSYQFIFKKNQTELEQVERENEELKLTVNRLEGYEMQRGEYIEATKRMKEDGEAIIVNFAPGLLTEDVIMYLYGLELVDANDVVVPSVAMETGSKGPMEARLPRRRGMSLSMTASGFTVRKRRQTLSQRTADLKISYVIYIVICRENPFPKSV